MLASLGARPVFALHPSETSATQSTESSLARHPCQAPSGAGAGAGAAAPADRLLRATRAMRLGDVDAALSLLSQEAREQPGGHLAFDLRAACCLASGRHEAALDDAMQCTKLCPEW